MNRIIVLLILLTGCHSYPEQKTGNLAHDIEGVWDSSSSQSRCNTSWQVISKQNNESSLLFRNATPIERTSGEVSYEYKYQILATLENGYHLTPQAEDRLNESGQAVTWYLIFNDANSFKWRRSDWAKRSFTPPVQRCQKPNIADPFVTFNAYSSNPLYGEVNSDHPGFKEDRSQCESVSYGQGVFIRGKGLVTDRGILNNIREKYSKPVIEAIKVRYKYYDFPTRYDIINMTGNKEAFLKEYLMHLKNVYSVFDSMTHPEHISTILTMSDTFEQCFRVEKQWKALRTEWIDTRTGKVFKVSKAAPQ